MRGLRTAGPIAFDGLDVELRTIIRPGEPRELAFQLAGVDFRDRFGSGHRNLNGSKRRQQQRQWLSSQTGERGFCFSESRFEAQSPAIFSDCGFVSARASAICARPKCMRAGR